MPTVPVVDAQRRPALPAWVLSCLLHLCLCVALVALVRTDQRRPSGEPDRGGGIVLATTKTNVVDYYREPESKAAQTPTKVSESTQAKQAAKLPTETDVNQLISAEWDLPGVVAARRNVDGLPTVDLRARGALRLPSDDDHSKILADEAERRRRKASLGPTTSVSLFGGDAAVGRSFVFVVDRSNSMGGEGLGALSVARAELRRALSSLTAEHKFQIVAYHHQRVRMGDGKLLVASDDAKRQVEPFLRGLAAFGGTDHMLAVQSALTLHPDVIFLLTDGGDPPLSAGQLTMVHRQAVGRTAIHCIQFGKSSTGPDDHFMRRLASQNQGTYRYVGMSRRAGD